MVAQVLEEMRKYWAVIVDSTALSMLGPHLFLHEGPSPCSILVLTEEKKLLSSLLLLYLWNDTFPKASKKYILWLREKKKQQSKVEHVFNFVSFFLSKKEERCNCPNVDLFSLPECQGQVEGKQTQAASSRQLGTQCRACCHMMAEVCLCLTETLNRKKGGQLHQVRNPHGRICCIRNRDSEWILERRNT